jgi:hypothetical protein
MTRRFANGRWEIRWRDSSGRHYSRRFRSEKAAHEFDESIHYHEAKRRRKELSGHQRARGDGGAR